ncbi:STE20-related kinase adapter protein alpha-like isoform X2 [Mizuhopecten yessoensis]|uniref:STE20-related kinase adapter protein alpha-like isoform X2 n=1 Tax=Mizuhopecten yessoensis TaxID=6573 RepID=UPI000B459258|nr:STE20-related kinase adapter protein alpha-like isoform X2 [Mizuhopecten yessoensis]
MSLLQCACASSKTKESPTAVPYSRKHQTTSASPPQNDGLSQGEDNRIHSTMMSSGSFVPDTKHYELYTVIGRGCNDTAGIILTKHIPSSKHIAIKKTNLESCDIDFSVLQNEVILCRQLQHEKVLPILTTFIHDHELWTVMPLMAYGSCKDLIHAYFTNGLSEQASSYILRDTLLALEYLHSKGIIHRSVRASHILVAANGNVCLSGLRDAHSMIQRGRRLRIVHDYPQHFVRSLQWLAPEILEQNLMGYDCLSDIYSVGITACELANGYAPFTDMPVTQMLLEKINGTKPVLADCTTIADLVGEENTNQGHDSGIDSEATNSREITDLANARKFSHHFHNFVEICLEKSLETRPSASTLLGHSFFKHLKKKTSEMLPSLIQPLSPLTDISKLPKAQAGDVDDLAEDINNMSMEEGWDF